MHRMVASRFAPYTNRGHIFGMPHDVHPVLFAYRKDVFDQEHIDPNDLQTWDDFIKVGRRLRRLPGEHPDGARYIIQLPKAEGWGVEILMFQRGAGYFDQEGRLTLDDDMVAETVEMYVPLVVGPDRISGDFGSWGQPMVRAMEDARTLGFLSPDWRCRLFENDMPRLRGKMAVMPLPAIKPGGRRTSTWGGTMIGITKHSKDVERAWEIAKYLYTDPASWERQWVQTGILPPVKEAWDLPAFHRAEREYWSNQKLAEILAASLPTCHRSTPTLSSISPRTSSPRWCRQARATSRITAATGSMLSCAKSFARRRKTSGDRCKEIHFEVLNRQIAPYVFLAPFALSFVVFTAYPLVKSLILAFSITSGPQVASVRRVQELQLHVSGSRLLHRGDQYGALRAGVGFHSASDQPGVGAPLEPELLAPPKPFPICILFAVPAGAGVRRGVFGVIFAPQYGLLNRGLDFLLPRSLQALTGTVTS